MSKKSGLIVILLLIACTGVFHAWKQYGVQPPGLIRLHVVANSNTFYDQDLKYLVKDRIVGETSASFKNVTSAEEARVLSSAESARIENIAREEIRRQGYDYPVRVELGTYYFPVKTYTLQDTNGISRLTLSPGRYEAVRVVIGNGRGANWWCVLYPPLCFADTNRALPPVAMPSALAVEKTDAPTGEENLGQPRIEYRFRTIELWKKIFR
ncbi:MAG: hypothetical protein VR67_10155 [Peptococcaceae bacterium BRH_c8a]|nr:MAG: hypothetical protein VR67_10155 [Peptococcaceae bacterium BRH_c8a]